MSQAIRDAAQALLKSHDAWATVGEIKAGWDALRTALSAQQPTADERVAQLMQFVEDAVSQAAWSGQGPSRDLMAPYIAAVEQSARALLSASQEDAEHAAMYRWLREGDHDLYITTGDLAGDGDGEMVPAGLSGSVADNAIRAAIRAAMSAKETK